jgi:hypothetical protein
VVRVDTSPLRHRAADRRSAPRPGREFPFNTPGLTSRPKLDFFAPTATGLPRRIAAIP